MSAIALVSDLIFATKIKSTADGLGVPLSVVRGVQALREAAGGASMAIIDLNVDGADPIEAIRCCKSPGEAADRQAAAAGSADAALRPVVVAFASHVQKDLIQAAEQAGADVVLPRSRFSVELPDLLQRYGRLAHQR